MDMVFGCDKVTDPYIREQLQRVKKIKSLAYPPICLPNIHKKEGLESPPQFVTATKKTIVPMLSAPSLNCGMSVFTTSLFKEDFSPEFFVMFARRLRIHVPQRIGKFQTFLNWIGIEERPFLPYDLTESELEDFFVHGAKAATKKYNLPESELENIEYGGSLFTNEEMKNLNLKHLIPRSSYRNAKHEMGYNFGGNHFLELHYVETIKDKALAERFNIKQNQLLFFYHGGGGHATYHLGRYFANRKKNKTSEKFALFFLKCIFHFGYPNGLKHFRERWKYYFSSRAFPEIPVETEEGKRLLHSIKAAMNYGYGYRVALLRRLIDALEESLPEKAPKVSFLWDAAHNSIIEEYIDGQQLIVHRQDAMRIFSKKPVMISGSNNTLSYIGVGGNNITSSFHSLSPSAAKTIERDVDEKKSTKDPLHQTLISKRKEKKLKGVPHTYSDGLFEVTRAFEQEGIIQPLAYIRPLASIKGH